MKHPYAEAMAVAQELHALLSPACSRCEIVGSLRRKKEEVGDIELLFVSRFEECADGLFDTLRVNMAAGVINRMLALSDISKRPNAIGALTWGKLNKLARHTKSGIGVDFFATTEENWWVSLVVRTGSLETNLKLTTGANARRGTLNAYGCGVQWWDSGRVSEATSEKAVFDLCGVPFCAPQFR